MKVRIFEDKDVLGILEIYQRAFAGYPWFENLSLETLWQRWNSNSGQDGFSCLVIEKEGAICGAIWWDRPDLQRLLAERGKALVDFVDSNFPNISLTWERDIVVDSSFQKKGIGLLLRQSFVEETKRVSADSLILTRMRDDNFAILKIAGKIGFKPTGISLSSSQKAGVHHEYWYYPVAR